MMSQHRSRPLVGRCIPRSFQQWVIRYPWLSPQHKCSLQRKWLHRDQKSSRNSIWQPCHATHPRSGAASRLLSGAPGASRGGITIGRGRSGRLERAARVYAGTARAPEGTADPRRLGPISASWDGVGWTVPAPNASAAGHVNCNFASRAEHAATRSCPAGPPLTS
jgi:hypothetical protein